MEKKADKLHLTSNVPSGFNENLTLWDQTFHVQTEHGGVKSPLLKTQIYHNGEIVCSKKTNYSNILNTQDFEDRLKNMMEKQHKDVTEEFTKKHGESRKKIQYFDAVKKLLVTKNHKQALKILQDAILESPDDPFIMSYYGYLRALVEKKYTEGIKICQKALKKLGTAVTPDEKSLYATFYLNLGRTYLVGGEKREAIEAFNKGLKIDRHNRDMLWELQKLGTRKRSVIPFLSRDNFLNKYLGIIFSRLRGK